MRASLLAGASLLAIAWTACATPTPSSKPSVVAREALPTDLRATWETYLAGGAAWELERERVRSDPARLRFVVDNLVIEMVRAYERSRLAVVGRSDGPFERAQRELVELADASTPVLVELLAMKDGIVAFLAADVLKRIGVPALEGVAEKLASESMDVRRRAAELLAELPNGGAREPAIQEALGRCVRSDAEWIVRAQAARSLGARGARHSHTGFALGVLARALADSDPAVVESACIGLAALGERRAIPPLVQSLERAAQRGEPKSLSAARAALRALSGETVDHTPAEWMRWWQSNGASATTRGSGAAASVDAKRD